ncbi:MAG: hypothetical protein E7434_04580 [Ruminococcaceae bacterium]|nr:hypothetical protein [Oscillospiraceae bacterium]
MSEQIDDKSIEQQPNNSTPEDNEGQGNKTFTQEEVNRIVSERLAKERAKHNNPSVKEQELAARESKLACREYLLDTGGDSVLLDILDTNDPDKFKASVEKLREAGFASQGASNQSSGVRMRTGMSHQSSDFSNPSESQIADAFKLKQRS